MPEVEPGFPRAWVEFSDPADEDQLIRADLTWLTSRWHCIFGNGCGGIDADIPFGGCCTLGAHFSDKDDIKRVSASVKQLMPDQWQEHPGRRPTKKDWLTKDDEGEPKTAVVDGACIFLNGPDFHRGAGCALHLLAQDEDISHVETKPDVCWQLPIRRDFSDVTRADGEEKSVVIITEYVRGMWGPGGHDLHWYCSSNTEAHTASRRVYEHSAAELTALLGEAAYEELVRQCDEHVAMLSSAGRPVSVEHPATARAQSPNPD
ncbi:MAG: hypothetical protein KDC39_10205 [Actinobacteria bacterium]|nr:hypothetical protein [Actinomycetota bacterium]